MGHTPARIILVTGASRGIGAQVASHLAGPDTHVVVNFREHAESADAVAEAIRRDGGHATTMRADVCDAADANAMIESVATRFGRLDVLILNASGSLDAGADPGDAIHRNHDAQQRLARLALPLMPVGARLVFVTSHQAHFFPHKAVPKGYAAVAASKRAGETALYAMRSEFDRAGIHFTVVSGDMIDESVVEFAPAIANAAATARPTGIVYVGGTHYLMTA